MDRYFILIGKGKKKTAIRKLNTSQETNSNGHEVTLKIGIMFDTMLRYHIRGVFSSNALMVSTLSLSNSFILCDLFQLRSRFRLLELKKNIKGSIIIHIVGTKAVRLIIRYNRDF